MGSINKEKLSNLYLKLFIKKKKINFYNSHIIKIEVLHNLKIYIFMKNYSKNINIKTKLHMFKLKIWFLNLIIKKTNIYFKI